MHVVNNGCASRYGLSHSLRKSSRRENHQEAEKRMLNCIKLKNRQTLPPIEAQPGTKKRQRNKQITEYANESLGVAFVTNPQCTLNSTFPAVVFFSYPRDVKHHLRTAGCLQTSLEACSFVFPFLLFRVQRYSIRLRYSDVIRRRRHVVTFVHRVLPVRTTNFR